MLIDLLNSLFFATILVAFLIGVIWFFAKFPKLFVIVLFVTIILVGLVIAPTVAEGLAETQGVITRVTPELFDGYPVIIVTVETVNGEVYTYFAEDEINVQGAVTLLLFGEEVVDVY